MESKVLNKFPIYIMPYDKFYYSIILLPLMIINVMIFYAKGLSLTLFIGLIIFVVIIFALKFILSKPLIILYQDKLGYQKLSSLRDEEIFYFRDLQRIEVSTTQGHIYLIPKVTNPPSLGKSLFLQSNIGVTVDKKHLSRNEFKELIEQTFSEFHED